MSLILAGFDHTLYEMSLASFVPFVMVFAVNMQGKYIRSFFLFTKATTRVQAVLLLGYDAQWGCQFDRNRDMKERSIMHILEPFMTKDACFPVQILALYFNFVRCGETPFMGSKLLRPHQQKRMFTTPLHSGFNDIIPRTMAH